MLARWGIRLGSALAGIALGLVVSAALLDGFSVDVTSYVVAAALFWVVHLVADLLALRVVVRQPSVATAGLLALASTIVALIVVNLLLDGISIRGADTYVLATLIVWAATVIGDRLGDRMLRTRAAQRG